MIFLHSLIPYHKTYGKKEEKGEREMNGVEEERREWRGIERRKRRE